MKKDKAKVLDEVWTEDRVRSFLDCEPIAGTDVDFHVLLKAYQSMRASDFKLFIDFFLEQKRNLDAKDPAGQSVLSIVSQHRHGQEYGEILTAAGAQ